MFEFNSPWYTVFEDLKIDGELVNARGLRTLEIENYSMRFPTPESTLCKFVARDLSIKYIAGEFAWYLCGNRNDRRIEEYSSFWKTIANEEYPIYNSNYGYYFFTMGQFYNVVDTLKADKDSRQAVVMINNKEVAGSRTKDKLCTNAVMFRIRNGELNMTVQMRSNDVVYGLGNDAVLFSLIHQMVYMMLLPHYPTLCIGEYYHTSASMHIYERHFNMLEDIVTLAAVRDISLPRISSISEALYLKNGFSDDERKAIRGKPTNIPLSFMLSNALLAAIKEEQ